MAANPNGYPNQVRSYTHVVDLVDTVVADNVNSLQDEIQAVETALGTAASTNPLTSTFSGTWSTATAGWTTVGDRLNNIEAGLVNGVSTAPYIFKTGGSTLTSSSNVGLTLKMGTGSSNLLESYSVSNSLGFNLTSTGSPRVGTNNVIYVNSTEYNALVSATSSSSSSAASKIPLATVTSAGDLIIGTGNATVSRLGIGTNGQALVSNGTTATWATPTDTTKIPLSTVTTAGDLILASGNAAVTRLGIGANGTVLTSNGTTASWVAPSTAYVSQTNGTVTTASTSSAVVRNISTSTASPTSGQGADGDVWLVYV
jgi:hypothetical protein